MRIATFAALMAVGLALPLAARSAETGQGLSLYGVVDAGVAVTTVSGQGSHSGLLNGGLTDSLWGMTGAEDMGGGWSARFHL